MLPRVVSWLSQKVAADQGATSDFSSVRIITPGRASQRRLMELLVDQHDGAVTPPAMSTPGALPEMLYKFSDVADTCRLADPLEVELAWVQALQQCGQTALSVLTPDPPAEEDFAGMLSLAKRLVDLETDLAASRVSWEQARDAVASGGGEPARWTLLEALQIEADNILEAHQLMRRDTARERAIETSQLAVPEHLVLVSTIDMHAVTRAMLAQIATTTNISILIHAPETHAAGFASDGTLISAYWSQQSINLRDENLCIVDQPAAQADAVVDALQHMASDETVATGDVAVAITDASLLGPVRRALEMAQDAAGRALRTRYAAGRSLGMSRPVVLLRLLATLAREMRLDRLGWLVRHPDFEQALTGPGVLDQYISDHLIHPWSPRVSPIESSREHDAIERVYAAAAQLLPQDLQQQPVRRLCGEAGWLAAIESALLHVYGEQRMSRYADEDRLTIDGLTAIAAAMETLRRLDQHDDASTQPLLPELGFSQAASLVAELAEAGDSPEPGDEHAIEISGFLETALDDHRFVIAAGLNEGMLPSSVVSDAFLPDSIRRQLGMFDNTQRYARDALLMHSLIASHERVIWIAGRRSEAGDPLKPSRLMLAGEYETMLQRLTRFFDPAKDEQSQAWRDNASAPASPAIATPARTLAIPRPVVDPDALEALCNKLPVTALAQYVRCPYRFYLRYLCKLRHLDDQAREMDPLAFGSRIHDVLKGFALGDVATSNDPDEIAADLTDRLDATLRNRYGLNPSVALRVQHAQALRRLEVFAKWQADQNAEGWHIDTNLVEHECTMPLITGVTLAGKLDRVDRHDDGGQWRVMDYKTGDSGADPGDHTQGKKTEPTWVNFQLPVYRAMLQHMGHQGEITTGYIALSKKPDDATFKPAPWDAAAYEQAMATAREIASSILEGVFWPPSEQLLADEFASLTLEGVWGRAFALSSQEDLP